MEWITWRFYPLYNKLLKRKKFYTGGIAILIGNNISEYVTVLTEYTSESVLWCKLYNNFTKKGLLIGAVYVHPETSPNVEKDAFNTKLEN